MIDTFGGASTDPAAAREFGDKIFAAAEPGAVFSPPVVSGAYTVITASEVMGGGMFGFGSGSAGAPAGSESATQGEASAGGGGGGVGGASGRPVAAIVVGPDGVKVEPIVDVTKIGLAAIGAWLSIALLLARRARARSLKERN